MENVLFDKKFTESSQYSYNSGWNKALRAYNEETIEVLKEKIGMEDIKLSELEFEMATTKS